MSSEDQLDPTLLTRLERAWAPARRHGALGADPVDRLLEHAAGFVPAAWRVRTPDRIVDLGSGVGVPGILVALLLPGTRVTLVDARARRADWARLAALEVGLGERVEVISTRLEDLGHDPRFRGRFQGAVARSLGSPAEVLELGLPLLSPGGLLVASTDGEGARRWEQADLAALGAALVGLRRCERGTWVELTRTGAVPDELPRPSRRRRRAPLV